MTKNKKRNH